MAKKIKTNFSLALIVSIVFHIGLVFFLGYNAWHVSSSLNYKGNGQSIAAIMIDSNIVSRQNQRELDHQSTSQAVKKQQQQQIEKQAQELQEKQLAEQQRLKQLAKENLLAAEKRKQEQEALTKTLAEKKRLEEEALKAKQQLEQQQKQALLDKQKAEDEVKLLKQNALQEQQKIELEKQAALLEAEKIKQEIEDKKKLLEQQRQQEEKIRQEKIRSEQLAKQAAENEKKQQQELNDILGGLTSKAPKSDSGASSAEINQFQQLVMNAISNKFINPNLYKGKNCILKIQLAADGLLLNVSSGDGDPALCREAISATKLAVFPKPKNNQIYQAVKNLEINFKPK